ncbi:MAG: N-6 DNA methylase [Synergistaceae bacterium]|nr:N-6 DNA methylase [Synergistaceae bacterium]
MALMALMALTTRQGASRGGFIPDSITLEGGLFSADLLEKICAGAGPFQSRDDYSVPKGLQLASEYSRAFHIAKAQWADFRAVTRQKPSDPRSASISFVKLFLRDVLGYSNVREITPISLAGTGYPVSMTLEDNLPVVVAPYDSGLDDASKNYAFIGSGRKKTPFQLMQEYLNAKAANAEAADAEAGWGIVTNGHVIRLLRSSEFLTRPRFLEFDLERIMDSELPDFKALWYVFHRSRLGDKGDESIWEKWVKKGFEEGSRVKERLRHGLGSALLALGNGFVSHPDNISLREKLHRGDFTVHDFYRELLRLIYRMLFVITLEERGLLHGNEENISHSQAADIYSSGYSFKRLRGRSLRAGESARHSDLWHGMRIVFRGLASGEPRLALPALGGLFLGEQCRVLDDCVLSNRALMLAMRGLQWADIGSVFSAIDYRNMGSEEIGSVYESLLEYEPVVNLDADEEEKFQLPGFGAGADERTAGTERKTTGSYYTPHSLVNELIKSALDPVIERIIAENPEDREKALLEMSVIDPSCGSGHFLIAAARRIAERLAQLRQTDIEAMKPETYRRALRDVVRECIYGVDLNPLAVELARFTLWLEGYEPGRSLTFIDNHVKCGNSLLGILHPDQMMNGIPDKAFDALSGDDKSVCSELKKQNRGGLKEIEKRRKPQGLLFEENDWDSLFVLDEKVSAMPDDTPDEADRKRREHKAAETEKLKIKPALAADAYVGAFLMDKKTGVPVPASLTLHEIFSNVKSDFKHEEKLESSRATCLSGKVFHWFVEFPEIILKRGGFDCVLGNPPWERIKLQEEEFFAARDPRVANARNKAEREKYIGWLEKGLLYAHLENLPLDTCKPDEAEKRLHSEFIAARRLSEAASAFCHVRDENSRYRLTGIGDVNTYALFAETMTRILSKKGRAGFIVPTGIATDDSTKNFFADLTQKGRLAGLYDFENRSAIFPGVHRSYKFCLVTVGQSERADFSFFLTDVKQLAEKERRFFLTSRDFAAINPNTKTCPIFRSRMDAELTRKIYSRVPVLIRDADDGEPERNPWGIKFSAMFHMSNDSALFKNTQDKDCLPLYEAKMIHQFDHRWAGYIEDGKCVDMPDELKRDPDMTVLPRYWVDELEVLKRLARVQGIDFDEEEDREKLTEFLDKRCPRWLMGWRDICRATDERTVIASVLPRMGTGDTLLLMFPNINERPLYAGLLAEQNSIVHDFIARQKIGGTHLKYHVKKQVATLPPDAYDQSDIDFITSRVLELTYTTHDLKPWAADIRPDHKGGPFPFDPERRAVLRAELDARYAKLYGLTRDELRYILDPSDVMGPDYPSETFRVLKGNEIAKYGEYRTQRLTLEAWDRFGY